MKPTDVKKLCACAERLAAEIDETGELPEDLETGEVVYLLRELAAAASGAAVDEHKIRSSPHCGAAGY